MVIEAFQRRFLPKSVNGIIDDNLYQRIIQVNDNSCPSNGLDECDNTACEEIYSETIHVTVNPVNDAPEAYNVAASTNEEEPIDINFDGFDLDEDVELSYVIVDSTLHDISLVNNNNGTFSYLPELNFNGLDITCPAAPPDPISISLTSVPLGLLKIDTGSLFI